MTAVAAVAALGFTALSLRATQEQIGLSEQGQLTDRFGKAVEQLGSDKLDVRLGGIYALERLAKDSPRDHPTIMEVLAAFTREHAPSSPCKPDSQPPTDIQATLTVIGRRDHARDTHPIDLHGTCLAGADLNRAYLAGAILTFAHLENALLSDAHLENALIVGANLNHAYPIGANLDHAYLTNATLTDAYLPFANLTGAILGSANLTGAHLGGANLTGVHLEKATLISADLNTADLTDAHLEGANLAGVRFERANLTNVNLGGATGVTDPPPPSR